MTILKQPLSKLRAKSVSGPRMLIVVASVATILITLVEMFRGALTVGMNWDAPTHTEAFDEWQTGKWAPNSKFGLDSFYPAFTYGFSFQYLSFIANALRGNEQSSSPEAYAVRNLTLVALFLLSCAAVYFISYLLFRNNTFAVLAVGIACALPTFVGHAFMNPIDVPPAVGYTLVTCSLCTSAIGLRSNRHFKSLGAQANLVGLISFFSALVGTWLAVGTRFAFWLPLLLLISVFSLANYLLIKSNRLRDPSYVWAAPPVGFFAGLLAVAALHPHYTSRLKDWLSSAVLTSGGFPYPGGTLTNGQTLPAQELPSLYLPLWTAASIPLGLLVFFWIGLLNWIIEVAARRELSAEVLARAAVVGQALMVGLVSIAIDAPMYNAQRHHLYLYPALAVIGAAGARAVYMKADKGSGASRRMRSYLVAGFVAVSLIYPTIERQRLFPYEYTYLNELATINGVNGRWETDYWATSFREALTRVPLGAELKAIGPQDTFYTYPHLQGTDVRTNEVAGPGEYWQIQITNGGMKLPENCRDVDSVTRNFRGGDVVMSWVGICTGKP